MTNNVCFLLPKGRWKNLVDGGVFPAAYQAIVNWHQLEGIDKIIASYKDQVLHTITDLGHAFTVWCSFFEVIPYLKNDHRKLLAAERFAEFIAQQHHLKKGDFTQLGDQKVETSDLISATLRRPGFLGHNLITLGTLFRYLDELETQDFNIALSQIKEMLEPIPGKEYRDVTIHYTESSYDYSSQDIDLEKAILKLIKGRD